MFINVINTNGCATAEFPHWSESVIPPFFSVQTLRSHIYDHAQNPGAPKKTLSSSSWLPIEHTLALAALAAPVLEQVLQRRQVRCMQRVALVLVQEDLRMLTHQCHGLVICTAVLICIQ